MRKIKRETFVDPKAQKHLEQQNKQAPSKSVETKERGDQNK